MDHTWTYAGHFHSHELESELTRLPMLTLGKYAGSLVRYFLNLISSILKINLHLIRSYREQIFMHFN